MIVYQQQGQPNKSKLLLGARTIIINYRAAKTSDELIALLRAATAKNTRILGLYSVSETLHSTVFALNFIPAM